MVAARGLFHIADGWSILAAGGIHYDLSASLSGDGLLGGIDLDSDSALGPMIEAGAYYDKGSLALDLTIRYSGLQSEQAKVLRPDSKAPEACLGRACSTSLSTTFMPAATKLWAMPRPMPLAAPVTTATLFFTSFMSRPRAGYSVISAQGNHRWFGGVGEGCFAADRCR